MMGKGTLIYNLMMDMKHQYRVLFIKTELCHSEAQKKWFSALGDSLIYKIYMDLNELKEILREGHMTIFLSIVFNVWIARKSLIMQRN